MASQQANADELTMPIQVEMGDHVVYCSVGSVSANDSIRRALQEGTPITFKWVFTVEAIANYWLNRHIGTVIVKHQVIPDLVSRTWLLKDDSNDIPQRVFSLDQALQFLVQIDHFPVLDRSLLQAEDSFLMRVDLSIHEGEINTSWWADLLGSDHISNSQAFTLP